LSMPYGRPPKHARNTTGLQNQSNVMTQTTLPHSPDDKEPPTSDSVPENSGSDSDAASSCESCLYDDNDDNNDND
jgi:hypothetical protein